MRGVGLGVSSAISCVHMASWAQFQTESPELSGSVLTCFQRHPHHILGTIRASGEPRLSGINVFVDEGVLWFGCMAMSLKAKDIRRDPRIALHSAPLTETLDGGDARINGVAKHLDVSLIQKWRPESPSDGEFFEIDIQNAHLVEVVGEEMVITTWDTANGLRIVNRR